MTDQPVIRSGRCSSLVSRATLMSFGTLVTISVRTSVSCSAQSFSMRPGILSGPAALRGLILDRVFLTSAGDRQSAWSLGGVGSFCADVSFCISNRE